MKTKMTAILCALALSVAAVASAATKKTALPAWQDPNVVQENRAPMTATFETDGLKLMLNGVWDFNWNENMNSRPMDFYGLNYNDENWDQIPVPGL